MYEKLKITNDIPFQEIFGKVGNERITKSLLEKIIGEKIDNLTLDTNKILHGDFAYDKIGRIDVKAKLCDGTKVLIEMQASNYDYMARRLLFYWAKSFSGELERGQDYEMLDKTIAILITSHGLKGFEKIKDYHTMLQISPRGNLELRVMEDFEIHIIELNKFIEGQNNPEDNWIKLLKGVPMNPLEKVEKEILEAQEELQKILSDPATRSMYEDREKYLRDKISFTNWAIKKAKTEGHEIGYAEGCKAGLKDGHRKGQEEGRRKGHKEGLKEGFKEGRREGIEEGIKKGRTEKFEQIIMSMNESGLSLEQICKISKLDKLEIEEILNRNAN